MSGWIPGDGTFFAESQRKRELFLALIAGGDTPERAAERVGIGSAFINAIILMDLASRLSRKTYDRLGNQGK